MLKNTIIVGLAFVVVMCWLKVDPECMKPDDPNSVVIEYECSNLDDYESVPSEVVDECKDRANQSTKHKNTN